MSIKTKSTFSCGVEDIKDRLFARIYGVVNPDVLGLRIIYSTDAFKEPSYTNENVIGECADRIQQHLLKGEGILVPTKKMEEFLKKQFESKNIESFYIMSNQKIKDQLDDLEEKIGRISMEIHKGLTDVGIVIKQRKPSPKKSFTKEVLISTATMLTDLEKYSRLPFSTMQKMNKKVLESCSSGKTFSVEKKSIRELADYWRIYKDVKCSPAEKDQTKKYRFKIDGEILVETDDYIEGMREIVSIIEKR